MWVAKQHNTTWLGPDYMYFYNENVHVICTVSQQTNEKIQFLPVPVEVWLQTDAIELFDF